MPLSQKLCLKWLSGFCKWTPHVLDTSGRSSGNGSVLVFGPAVGRPLVNCNFYDLIIFLKFKLNFGVNSKKSHFNVFLFQVSCITLSKVQWYLGIRFLWNKSKLGIRPAWTRDILLGTRPLFGIRPACFRQFWPTFLSPHLVTFRHKKLGTPITWHLQAAPARSKCRISYIKTSSFKSLHCH